MYARSQAFASSAASAMLRNQNSFDLASLIPCHARGCLLGPKMNSLFRMPRQYVSEYYVKPRDTLW